MKYSNNNGNERESAAQTKAPDPVTDQDQRVIPTAAETIVKIEPLKAPETEEKSSQAPEQALDESKPKPNKSKRLMIVAGLGIVAAITGVFGTRWWMYASSHQSTDDGYVSSDVHPVSSRINGTVTNLLVNDNQQVHAGQLLVHQ